MAHGHNFIKIDKLDLSEENLTKMSSDPLTMFYNAIKSHDTERNYTRNLKYFFCEVLKDVLHGSYEERAKQFVDFAKNEPERLNNILYGYVINLKKRTELPVSDEGYMAIKTIKNRIKPLTKFCDMNDIMFNWKRLRSLFPEDRDDYPEMRGYTKDEIRLLLEYAPGPRDKAIMLIAASSGIRTGAFDFDWGDVRPIYSKDEKLIVAEENSEVENAKLACATILVYKGSREAYDAFITPEAYAAIFEYRNLWTFEIKRKPLASDYVFKKSGSNLEQLDRVAITRAIQKIRMRSGLNAQLKSPKRRMQVPVMHGFRKFFNKEIKNTPSDSNFIGQYILKERMMGHASLVQLDKNYYKENLIEKAAEYIKSVPYLTLSKDRELQEKNTLLEKEKENLEKDLPKMVYEAVAKMKQELISDHEWFPKKNSEKNGD